MFKVLADIGMQVEMHLVWRNSTLKELTDKPASAIYHHVSFWKSLSHLRNATYTIHT